MDQLSSSCFNLLLPALSCNQVQVQITNLPDGISMGRRRGRCGRCSVAFWAGIGLGEGFTSPLSRLKAGGCELRKESIWSSEGSGFTKTIIPLWP